MDYLLLCAGVDGPTEAGHRPDGKAVGNDRTRAVLDGLRRAAASAGVGIGDVEVLAVAAAATAAEQIDTAVTALGGRRLVIDAGLADLAEVLRRLLRGRLLSSAETAVLPREKVPFLHRLGLPESLDGQLQIAVSGVPRLVGVIKEDSGGLCVDRAELRAWPTAPVADGRAGWWLRAVVDDQRLCDGPARAISVRRLGPAELEATVHLGRVKKRTLRGRALQLACDEALISQDGIDRARPRSKRTFWSEPELWNLCG